jgi:hypothetical protein
MHGDQYSPEKYQFHLLSKASVETHKVSEINKMDPISITLIDMGMNQNLLALLSYLFYYLTSLRAQINMNFEWASFFSKFISG